MSKSPRYLELLGEAAVLHEQKNDGYAGVDAVDPWVNFREAETFGVSAFKGCLIRMSDKYIRVANLLKNPDNDKVGESITDTLFDLSAYALIAICLYEEKVALEKDKQISLTDSLKNVGDGEISLEGVVTNG